MFSSTGTIRFLSFLRKKSYAMERFVVQALINLLIYSTFTFGTIMGYMKPNKFSMNNIKSLKIFIVDDDPFCSGLYQKHLEGLGFTNIHCFNDGQYCINNLTEDPAIIFLDYNMDSMTGLEVLKKIKRFNPDIFTVLVSAQEDMQVAINALKYGAFDYLIKGRNDLEMMDAVLQKIANVVKMLQKQTRSKWFSFNLF